MISLLSLLKIYSDIYIVLSNWNRVYRYDMKRTVEKELRYTIMYKNKIVRDTFIKLI